MLGRLLRTLAATFGLAGHRSNRDHAEGGARAGREEEEALRQWVMEQLRTQPLKYLEQAPERLEPVGPGIRLGDHLVDYYALQICFPGGHEHTINISKMHRMVRGRTSPEEREGCLAHMLRSCTRDAEMDLDSWAAVRPALLPAVKGQAHPETVALPWGSLVISLVIDTPHNMAYFRPDRLQTWGRTPEEVLSVAMENASRLHAGVTVRKLPREEAGNYHIWAVDTDPDYSASTVLLPQVVGQVPLDREDMYVLVPQRSCLFFVEKPASALDRVFLLHKAIEIYEGGGYPVSLLLHVWNGDRLAFASAEEITGGDPRFFHDGGVLVPANDSEEFMLVRIPEEGQIM